MMKYDLSWSGGKDSTASVIIAHEIGFPIRQINYCRIMYNQYIPADLPIMTEFVENAIETFKSWGYKVNILTPRKTAVDIAYTRFKRSRTAERNGKYYGAMAFARGMCHMTGEKQYILSKEEYPSIIGIAADERERLTRLGLNISLLAEYGVTEHRAFEICQQHNLLSPLYSGEGIRRGGCFFCANVNKCEIEYIKSKYPKLYDIALSLVKICDFPITSTYNNWVKEYFRSTGKNR